MGDCIEDGVRFLFKMNGYEKHKLLHGKLILDVRNLFIYLFKIMRLVKHWNKVPKLSVESTFFERLKTRLDKNRL